LPGIHTVRHFEGVGGSSQRWTLLRLILVATND
jgi:hypothetical protein